MKIMFREDYISTLTNRMQPDFGELALASAADAKRYVA